MSSSLIWKKVVRQEENYLPDELKFVLRKRYAGNWPVVLNLSDSMYLEGLQDAEVKGAEELLKALQENKEIKIYEEY